MKKIHIIIVIVTAVIGAILLLTYSEALHNTTFSDARVKAGKQVKITGTLDKTATVEYDALKNPNLTVFTVEDKAGQKERVYLTDTQGKPMGLEMSESVTLEGKFAADGSFQASHMQMKCPSKYNDEKHSLTANTQ
jgi:cytochrome c-type biogenesis protein CcmE